MSPEASRLGRDQEKRGGPLKRPPRLNIHRLGELELLLEGGEELSRVVVEDVVFVARAEERERIDDRHHVVGSLAGFRSHRGARAWRLSTEEGVLHALLL